MTIEYSAKYFDGKKSLPFKAKVHLENKGLSFNILNEGKTDEHLWLFSDLQLLAELKFDVPAIFSSKTEPHARLIIHDETVYQEIVKHISKKNIISGNVSYSWGMLILIGLGCLVLFFAALFVIPVGAPLAAKLIPQSWDNRLGQWVIHDVVEEQHQCIAPEGVAALNKLVTKLVPDSNLPFDVRVIQIKASTPNAFAVPGYHLIIFNSLLNFADNPDEVAGVLAHEMGHAISHHPTAGLIRQIGFKAVMIGAFGSTVDIASGLLDVQYTRKNEQQADEIATQLLHQAKISNKGLAQFFEKLKKEFGSHDHGMTKYLASHPGLEERVEFVSKQPNPEQTQPSLTPEEWRALKNICKETIPLKFEKIKAGSPL